MLDIIKQIINLIQIAIEELFKIQIDLYDDVSVSLGVLIIAFVLLIVTIYLILNAVGFNDRKDSD